MVKSEFADPVKAHIILEAKRSTRPSQRNYNALVNRHRRTLVKLVAALAETGSVATFSRDALMVLEDGHIDAGVYGRQLSGDLSSRTGSDVVWGLEAMRTDSALLARFMDQLRAKDRRYYDEYDKVKEDAVTARLNTYTNKFRGTSNTAYVVTSPDSALFDWVMLNSEHCDRCPQLQDESPYTKRTLPTKPGMCETPCLYNCGCVLVRYGGNLTPTVGPSMANEPVPNVPLDDLTTPISDDDMANWFAA